MNAGLNHRYFAVLHMVGIWYCSAMLIRTVRFMGLIIAVVLSSCCWTSAQDDGAPASPVVVDYFYKPGCPDCKRVRYEILPELRLRFEGFYEQVKSGDLEDLYRRWNACSLILGKEVVIESEGERRFGKALRIDHKGTLVIQDQRGLEQEILAGDVSLRF